MVCAFPGWIRRVFLMARDAVGANNHPERCRPRSAGGQADGRNHPREEPMIPGVTAAMEDAEWPDAFGTRTEVPDRIVNIPDGKGGMLGMAFRPIPACPGGFLMGSRGYRDDESPRHRVLVPQPLYAGTFPVTQREFACFRSEHTNAFPGNPVHPAENLSWHDAREFLAWLVREARNLPRGFVPRLPCEAEWEYACRAGTDTEYHSGDGEAALEEVGWHRRANSRSITHPVGRKPGNLWGLHDMHGNIEEWCWDVYDRRAYSKRGHPWLAKAWSHDAAGKDAVRGAGYPHRVARGGSWFGDPGWCRAASRNWRHPGSRNGFRGFRVFLSPPEVAPAPTLPT
jgi:formylglycine-generating enzyme required for sulfatase activity